MQQQLVDRRFVRLKNVFLLRLFGFDFRASKIHVEKIVEEEQIVLQITVVRIEEFQQVLFAFVRRFLVRLKVKQLPKQRTEQTELVETLVELTGVIDQTNGWRSVRRARNRRIVGRTTLVFVDQKFVLLGRIRKTIGDELQETRSPDLIFTFEENRRQIASRVRRTQRLAEQNDLRRDDQQLEPSAEQRVHLLSISDRFDHRMRADRLKLAVLPNDPDVVHSLNEQIEAKRRAATASYLESSIRKNLEESAVQPGVVIRFLIAGDRVRVVAHQSRRHVHLASDHRVFTTRHAVSDHATVRQTGRHLT